LGLARGLNDQFVQIQESQDQEASLEESPD